MSHAWQARREASRARAHQARERRRSEEFAYLTKSAEEWRTFYGREPTDAEIAISANVSRRFVREWRDAVAAKGAPP